MGRHPKDEFSIRCKGLRVRLTKAEYSWIQEIAKQKETNMCEVLREAFRESVRKMNPDEFAEMSVKIVERMKK